MTARPILALTALVLASSVATAQDRPSAPRGEFGPNPTLPAPDTNHRPKNFVRAAGWPEGQTPRAAAGLTVTRFAADLESPRWALVLPNGDVLISEGRTVPREGDLNDAKVQGHIRAASTGASPDRITLLRDTNGDGVADHRTLFLGGLKQPFGMVYKDGQLYVANTDSVMRYPFKVGDDKITGAGTKLLDLPAGGYNNHWTRNLMLSRDGSKLLVSVGSASNNGEFGLEVETRRAVVLEIGLDGSNERIVASGLRNPVGMAFHPTTGQLWTAVNERDDIGDSLVPDYITTVRDGGFYGWPFAYWGKNVDPRLAGQRPDLVERSITPDYALGAHTASLGLAFVTDDKAPEALRNGVLIAQRGSWNRSDHVGYKVLMVPFRDGMPAGEPRDVLTGFLSEREASTAYGRPVGVFQDNRGGVLVTDDAGKSVWRVTAAR